MQVKHKNAKAVGVQGRKLYQEKDVGETLNIRLISVGHCFTQKLVCLLVKEGLHWEFQTL